MTALNACPFCGGVAQIYGNFEHGYQIAHSCIGDSLFRISVARNTEDEAVAAWNRRAYHASEPDAEAVERGADINAPGMRETIAAAIANARGMRRGVPTISNILDILPAKLRDEVIDDAENVLAEIARARSQP